MSDTGDTNNDDGSDGDGEGRRELARHYAALEFALVRAATAALNGSALPEGAPLVSAETAIKLLTLRSAARAQAGEDGRLPPIDPAQLRQIVSARIAAVRHVTAVPTGAAPDPTTPE